MNDTRKAALQEQAKTDALTVLWLLSLRNGVEPTAETVDLVATCLMAFGAAYACEAFDEYREELRRVGL